MSVLTKVLGKSTKQIPSVECPHIALSPRWANIEDMGKPDRVASYLCTACQKVLTVQEAREYLR